MASMIARPKLSGGLFLLTATFALAGCGQPDRTVPPLPQGSGLYFTEESVLGGDALFYQADELTGGVTFSGFPGDGDSCGWLNAMDVRSDGRVLGVSGTKAKAFLVDPRSPSRCVPLGNLPAVMRAVAVHPDGRVFAIAEVSYDLYELDANLHVVTTSPVGCSNNPDCLITGIDFAPNGDLYAINSSSDWGVLDVGNGTMIVGASIGLRDDFDIDSEGTVRALTGGELRTFATSGAQLSAVNLENGTTFATGVVYR